MCLPEAAGGVVDALDLDGLWRRGSSRQELYRVLDLLAARRRAMGIPARQVAKRLGVSVRRLRRIDAGEVGHGELARYARTLGYRLVVTVPLPGEAGRRCRAGDASSASPAG